MYRACKASNEICAAMLLHSHPWCLCSKVIQLIFLWRAKHTTNYIFKHFHFKNSNNIIAFARTNQWTNARHFSLSLFISFYQEFFQKLCGTVHMWMSTSANVSALAFVTAVRNSYTNHFNILPSICLFLIIKEISVCCIEPHAHSSFEMLVSKPCSIFFSFFFPTNNK